MLAISGPVNGVVYLTIVIAFCSNSNFLTIQYLFLNLTYRTVEMAGVATTEVECGYCWDKGEDLINPRILPCSHVHCLRCLNAHFESDGVIRCPLCR